MFSNLENLGYLGLFIAAFLAATVLPFSSEAILGILVHQKYNIPLLIAVATIGNSLGGITTFFLGYLGKMEWLEKYFRVKKEKILSFKKYSDKYGAYLGILSWMPIIGDVIGVGLGFFKAKPIPVIFWMTLGRFLRYVFIAWTVYKLV